MNFSKRTQRLWVGASVAALPLVAVSNSVFGGLTWRAFKLAFEIWT